METAFLVGARTKDGGTLAAAQESLDELARLAETAGAHVSGRTLQSMERPSPATFIGKGKVEELRRLAQQKKFQTLVFDEELKPAQQKNLTEEIPVKILDRTRLILDIFAKRARTREGILQVELAQLSYMLPRMTERYGRFEQQVGGIGTRGPGERKLEVEARHIRDRMARLRREIETVKMHRDIARERRHSVPMPVVAIVGYTNAGKSTLLNALVETAGQPKEKVYADDKLFATLDPTTRRIKLPSGRWALFTDTVGFIRKLPTNLVAAFRSTLEETTDADLLIHLLDATDSNRQEHAEVVMEILKSLDADAEKSEGAAASLASKILTVYNKADALDEAERLKIVNEHRQTETTIGAQDPLFLSATRKTGLPRLLETVEERLSAQMIETEVDLPFKKMNILPSLYRLGKIERVAHKSRGVSVRLRLEKAHWSKLQSLLDGEKPKK